LAEIFQTFERLKSYGTPVALEKEHALKKLRTSSGDLMRIDDVLQRIQGEFVEMPGLRLTPAQAQRLWGLDRTVCDQLLGTLVEAKFLSRTRDGAFVRTDGTQARRMAPGNAA
jgi:hypothetical protein